MAANVKKGDKVYVFGAWNRKGTVYYRMWTVRSAGEKIIHLHDGDTNAKCDFRQQHVNAGINGGSPTYIEPVSAVPDPEARALEIAAECIAAYREHHAHRRQQFADASPGYHEALNKSEAKIHEPRALLITH